ncbi:DUF1592 domain-containing protein [Elongatibacter sediminis]|uniref:DUF1592 domain-containing protein n=1 Tax=Elongatibacter sediminis TaxID=3119006 RepID=A0AAW9R9W1_9GAMM
MSATSAPVEERRVGGFYRLTEEQYRQVIRDVLGTSIVVGGRFQPFERESGLLAVGAGIATTSASGLELYDAMAREVAAQATAAPLRTLLIGCTPEDESRPDQACASQFLNRVGRLLFRQPLSPEDSALFVQIAADTSRKLGGFHRGLQESLATMLVDPRFLFRIEMLEPDPDHPGEYRLDSYSRASRLSFWLWNSIPDEALLAAAEAGELLTEDGLARQVDRMLASPKLERGVRAYFTDLLRLDGFNTLSKDVSLFPRYTAGLSEQAVEQTLRTIVHHVLVEQGDYRDIFTLRQTFLTRTLGAVYGVPVIASFENGAPEPWVSTVYPENDPRTGILSHISFVALHSHAGRSSPTLRGKALREIFLCQNVPPPPGDVDFSRFETADTSKLKTMRERLSAHANEPLCAGCHQLTDPLGLALETFDAAGVYRTTENGATIDTSGNLHGVTFQNSAELGQVVRNDPTVPVCAVNRAFAYGAGKPAQRQALEPIEEEFAESGFRFVNLLRTIALSDAFFGAKPDATQLAANR